jgi:cytochrome oxidase Cu insertion factor (SCO1/SenC/PrrC family)
MIGAAVVGLCGGWWAARWQSAEAGSRRPRTLVDFSLVDRTGRTVTRAELTNQFLVVNSLFTSCSLSCRAVNDRMEEIQRLTAGMPDVRLVSLTVDPRTDTVPVLARFADRYHADTNRWLFLTGDKKELYRLLETSFSGRAQALASQIPGGFTHTDRILLLDRQGAVRESFDGLAKATPRNVVAAVERLRSLGR